MKIEKYVASLAPSMRKDQILDDIISVRKELKEATIPAYETIATLLGKWKWKSKEMQGYATAFGRIVSGGHLVDSILKGLKEISGALDVAEDYITKTYNEETVSAAITYKKANVLQFVDAIAFITRYARRYANYMLVCETSMFEDSDTSLTEAFAPAELSFIEGNFVMFCQGFKAIAIPAKEVQARIEEAPEVIVKSASANLIGETLGAKKTDSFGLNFIAAKWNPFYHIGKAIAEFQVSSYNAAKEELQLVQMRKLFLEKLNAKKPDAALAHEIQYTEGRLQNLTVKLAKQEAAYA
jgi:hypothetical protein